jgi:hypothetical protein
VLLPNDLGRHYYPQPKRRLHFGDFLRNGFESGSVTSAPIAPRSRPGRNK